MRSQSDYEQNLLRSLIKGDTEAFEEIYRKYNKKIYAFSLKYLKSKEDAEGVVQDVFNGTPVLLDYATGRICINYIDNINYLLMKINRSPNMPQPIKPLSWMKECEVVRKGLRGRKVQELQNMVNTLKEEIVFAPDGAYSSDMVGKIDSIFDGTNVLLDKQDGAICYMFIQTTTAVIELRVNGDP